MFSNCKYPSLNMLPVKSIRLTVRKLGIRLLGFDDSDGKYTSLSILPVKSLRLTVRKVGIRLLGFDVFRW